MKTTLFTCIFLFALTGNTFSQKTTTGEKYGNTLNAGFGIGYYGYVGHSLPVLHADFEFNVARNFTLAPFITYYAYNSYRYWGNHNYPYRNYSYKQSVMPIGLKGSYYFDSFLGAGSKWDFYLAGSLGFAIRKTVWENGYYGDRVVEHGTSSTYFDGHIGTEYHFNNKIGLLLDLSTGISTLCLAIHL